MMAVAGKSTVKIIYQPNQIVKMTVCQILVVMAVILFLTTLIIVSTVLTLYSNVHVHM